MQPADVSPIGLMAGFTYAFSRDAVSTVVSTKPGYSGNPGHAGTGTVVARVCG